jgi:hypothetical protein
VTARTSAPSVKLVGVEWLNAIGTEQDRKGLDEAAHFSLDLL